MLSQNTVRFQKNVIFCKIRAYFKEAVILKLNLKKVGRCVEKCGKASWEGKRRYVSMDMKV